MLLWPLILDCFSSAVHVDGVIQDDRPLGTTNADMGGEELSVKALHTEIERQELSLID